MSIKLHRKEKGRFCRRIVGLKRELNDTLLECRVWKVVCNTTSPLTNEWTKFGPLFIRYILTANFQNPPLPIAPHFEAFILFYSSLYSLTLFFSSMSSSVFTTQCSHSNFTPSTSFSILSFSFFLPQKTEKRNLHFFFFKLIWHS